MTEQHSPPNGEDPERVPLLTNQPPPESGPDSPFVKARQRILVLVCISIVAADFGVLLSYAPQIEILESLICDSLRAQHGLRGQAVESFCKSPVVQGDLVLLTGWKDTFDQIPGIVLALPYGYLADHIGRKPVLLLSLAGLVLEELTVRLICWWHAVIPLRAIWFTPLCQILGGGPQIATSMAYAMVTDLFPAPDRAAVFFLIGAVIIVGEILAGPLSAMMMLWTPWFPMTAGLVLQLVAFMAAVAVPETQPRLDHHATAPLPDSPGPSSTETPPRLNWTHAQWWKQSWVSLQQGGLVSANVLCILGSFLLAGVGRQALQLIVQYASKRFSWSIAAASLVITFKAVVNVLALTLLLPRISSVLGKHMSAAGKDRVLVQASASALAIGALIMAVSPYPGLFIVGVGVLALGWGYYSAARSLAAALVPASEIGMLSTLLGLAQSVGTMVAGPALALAFKRGIELGGAWFGLPYLVAAALFFGATCLNFGVRLHGQEKAVAESESEPGEHRAQSI